MNLCKFTNFIFPAANLFLLEGNYDQLKSNFLQYKHLNTRKLASSFFQQHWQLLVKGGPLILILNEITWLENRFQ